MANPKVYFIPGLFSSRLLILAGADGRTPSDVWTTPTQIGLMIRAGLGDYLKYEVPNRIFADGLFEPVVPFYNKLRDEMKEREVTALSYDWRLSPTVVAPGLARRISMSDDGFYIIAHSLGCLVALAVVEELVHQGHGGLCKGIFHIGGPLSDEIGNWSALQAVMGRGLTWNQVLNEANLGPNPINWLRSTASVSAETSRANRDRLLRVISTWPSISMLMPNGVGLRDEAAMRSLCDNQFITQAWLTGGQNDKAAVQRLAFPRTRTFQFYGTGITTTSSVELESGAVRASYDGDGTVLRVESLYLEERTMTRANVEHLSLLADNVVLRTIVAMINTDAFEQTNPTLNLVAARETIDRAPNEVVLAPSGPRSNIPVMRVHVPAPSRFLFDP